MNRVVGDGGKTSASKSSALGPSNDDRLTLVDGATLWDDNGGGIPSSDWLMAGETARAGMINIIAAENSGRPGPVVVNDGAFQARLLCPSQVRTWLSGSREVHVDVVG